MVTKVQIEETFENSQRVRNEHWRSGPRHDLFTTHRSSCPYCFNRLRGLPLPKLKVVLRHLDSDGFEVREILDEADPRIETGSKPVSHEKGTNK